MSHLIGSGPVGASAATTGHSWLRNEIFRPAIQRIYQDCAENGDRATHECDWELSNHKGVPRSDRMLWIDAEESVAVRSYDSRYVCKDYYSTSTQNFDWKREQRSIAVPTVAPPETR